MSHIRVPCKLKGPFPSPLRLLTPGCTSSYHPRAVAVVAVAMTTGRGFIFNSGRRLEQCLRPAPRGSRVPENASRPSLILVPDVPLRLQNSSRPALISSWASLLCQESKGREKHRTRRGPQEPAASMRRWWPDGRGISSSNATRSPSWILTSAPGRRTAKRCPLFLSACEKVEGLAGQDAQNNRDKTVRNSTQVQPAPGSRC